MVFWNDILVTKIYIFMLFFILKVFAREYNYTANTEIIYDYPILNYTNTNITSIVNKNDNYIYKGFDTTFIYIFLFFAVIFIGIKFLISVISRQIKEEMRNDYLLI